MNELWLEFHRLLPLPPPLTSPPPSHSSLSPPPPLLALPLSLPSSLSLSFLSLSLSPSLFSPSSPSTQDAHLLDFMSCYYELITRLGSDIEEKTLAASISNLSQAESEPLVQFLYTTLNNLASLLVRPSITEESGGCGLH